MPRDRRSPTLHWLAALALAVLCAPACKSGEECDRARLANASAWEKVKGEAGRLKFQGVAGYEEMTASQKAAHVEAFRTVEEQAGLVFESFAFQKISWTTGSKARDRAVQEFNTYFDKDKYSGFKAVLDAAQKRFNEAEAACR